MVKWSTETSAPPPGWRLTLAPETFFRVPLAPALLGIGVAPIIAGLVGCQIITIAGIKAAQDTNGLGSWQVHFLDALSKLNDQDLVTERILTNDK